MNSRLAIPAGLIGLMCLLPACGTSPQASTTATAISEQPSATPQASARTPRSAPAAEPCPTGELCTGFLGPGDYTTDAIGGATISMSLQSEWEAEIGADAGFVNLYHQGSVPAIIGVAEMAGEVFADPCDDRTTAQIERTPQALMDWLAAQPAIKLGEIAPATLGEATGLRVELTASKAEPCPAGSQAGPDVILLWPLSETGAFLFADDTTAIVYALEVGGELVVVTAETIFDPEEWRPVVQPVLDSMEFSVRP